MKLKLMHKRLFSVVNAKNDYDFIIIINLLLLMISYSSNNNYVKKK